MATKTKSAEEERIAELEAEVENLKAELEGANVRLRNQMDTTQRVLTAYAKLTESVSLVLGV